MDEFARDLRCALDEPFDRRNRKKKPKKKKGKFSLQMKSTELPEGYNVAKHIFKNNPIQKRKEMFTKKQLEKKLKGIDSDSDEHLPFKKNVCRFFTPCSTVDKWSTLSGSDDKKKIEIPPFYTSLSAENGSFVTTGQFPDQELFKMSTEDVHTSEMAEVQTDNYKEVSSNHDSNITGALHFTDVSHINSYVATKQPSLPRHGRICLDPPFEYL